MCHPKMYGLGILIHLHISGVGKHRLCLGGCFQYNSIHSGCRNMNAGGKLAILPQNQTENISQMKLYVLNGELTYSFLSIDYQNTVIRFIYPKYSDTRGVFSGRTEYSKRKHTHTNILDL